MYRLLVYGNNTHLYQQYYHRLKYSMIKQILGEYI